MKKSLSLLCNLLLSSTLFWGVPSVEAEEMISMIPTDITDYCHLKFPTMRKTVCLGSDPCSTPLLVVSSISTAHVTMAH